MSFIGLLGIISKYFSEAVSTASKALMRDLDGGYQSRGQGMTQQ